MNYRERKKKEKNQLLYNKYNNYNCIHQLITDVVLTKTGKVKTSTINHPLFKSSKAYKEIINLTTFLDVSVSISERIYCISHQIKSRPLCIVCGKDVVYLPQSQKGYSKTCNNPSCKTTACVDKRLKTLNEKYGGNVSPKTVERAKERINHLHTKGRETLKQKYNVNNPGKLPNHGKKMRQTLLEKYGVDHPTKIEKNILERKNQYFDRFQSRTSDVTITQISPPTENKQQVIDFVKEFDSNIIINDRTLIAPHELDIVSQQYKVAIEYDGLFWHSYNHVETTKERNYHLNKTLLCLQNEYKLIHIFENEWKHKSNIVKSRLRNIFNQSNVIYARKCNIKVLTFKESSPLINQWHIQGNASASVYIGLEYNGEIVSIMSFSKSRFNKNVEWEMIRFCSKLNTSVVGGASKIFSYFIKNYNPQSVISYADRRWGEGSLYLKLGFEHISSTRPNYFYYREGNLKLHNRIKFQKHKLREQLEYFDPKLTEAENMFNNKYRRLWDCGNQKYIWKK